MKTKTGVCRPCCVVESCLAYLRNFNESSTSSLGGDLEEVSGDWEIVSNTRLKPPTDGVLRIVQAVPTTSTDGYKVVVTALFGASGTPATIRVHVDIPTSSGSISDSHYLEVNGTGIDTATMQLFKLTSGTPTPVGSQEDILNFVRNSDIVISVCVNTATNEITANVTTVLGGAQMIEEAATLHGSPGDPKYVALEVLTATTNMRFDDLELRRLGGVSECADCQGDLQVCEVCENSDTGNADKAPNYLRVTWSGLADRFIDNATYSGTGFFGTLTPDSVDDHIWAASSLAGTAIIPFIICGGPSGSGDSIACPGAVEHDGALIYGNADLAIKSFTEGLTQVNGQTPFLDSGVNYRLFGGAAEAVSHISTRSINFAIRVWLARKNAGGFKIYADVRIYAGPHLWKVNTGSGEAFAPPWQNAFGGSTLAQLGRAEFEGDWDGDCLALPDTNMTLVEECDISANNIVFTGMSLTIGLA